MMSPQQAFRLFVYADWAMLIVGIAAIGAAIGWAIYAVLPRNRGQRRRVLLKALMSFLVVAMFWGTQASVTVAFFHEQWTPLFIVLFALPVVVMLVGLIASIAYAARAILRRTGKERRQMLLRSLVGVFHTRSREGSWNRCWPRRSERRGCWPGCFAILRRAGA